MMTDEDKSKQQLIEELVALRQQVAELQTKNISAKESNQLGREALRESEERYRRLLELSFDAIMIHQAGKLVAVNEPGASLYGAASPEELVGKPILDFVHPDFLEAVQARIGQTRGEAKEVPLIEEKLVRLDGTSLDVEVAAVPISYQGQPAIQAVVRNITRRKQAEKALRESEAKFRTLAETTTAGIFIYQGIRFRYVNPAATAISGYSQAELLEMNILDVIHPDFRQLADERRIARLRGEPVSPQYELKILTKDGQARWLELSAGLIQFEGEPAVLGTAFDITERKRVEEALRQSTQALARREAQLAAEMQSVLAISRALVSEINLDKLLEFIIAQAEHLISADGAAVFLLTKDGQNLEIVVPGQLRLGKKPSSRVLVKGSLAEMAISSQKVQMSNHVPGDDCAAAICALLPAGIYHSLLCAPLTARGINLGVLLIWSQREHSYDREDSRLIGLFADQAALALHNAHLHSQNRQLAIEQERHRLARDLHDSVTQSLYSIGLAAQTAQRLLGPADNSRLQAPLTYIQTLSQTALAEVREQIYHLHPVILKEKGLVKTLARYCEILTKRYGLAIEFVPGPKLVLSAQQQEELYYIAREALWNVVKHADATRVKIALTREVDQTVLSVVDDGFGFEPSLCTKDNTIGLRNMAERARLLSGTFELQTTPGRGTQVIVRIPL